MASKLWHPDTWAGRPWMEVMCNLTEALNERYYAGARQFGFAININSRRAYDRWLSDMSRSIKQQLPHWYNYVRGLSHVINTATFTFNDLKWTMADIIADIGTEPDFFDYESDPFLGEGYKDAEKVLIQYYEIIVRMKECLILNQGTYGEGGNDFYHPWRDNGVYNLVSIESNSTINKNGTRNFSIEKHGMYQNDASPITFRWPDNVNYPNTPPALDTDHNTQYANLYQWFPVNGFGDNFNTAGGVFPSGPYFGRTNQTQFRARAEGDDGTFPGPAVRKDNQAAQYDLHRLHIEYVLANGSFQVLNGKPKLIKYPYHVDHLGTDDLQCPFADNVSAFYETTLDINDEVEIMFGEHTNRPVSIDIPMVPGGGVFQAFQGFTMTDSGSWAYFIEVWDDGSDGGLEYYEPVAP